MTFFNKDHSFISKPETSLVNMLVIVKCSGAHYKREIIFLPTTFEYRSTNFTEYFNWVFIKWTILWDPFGIENYIFIIFLLLHKIIEPAQSWFSSFFHKETPKCCRTHWTCRIAIFKPKFVFN